MADDGAALTEAILDLAGQFGHYGYRQITALLRAQGWRVNGKGVVRIWRQERLKVSAKQPKPGRLWLSDGYCIQLRTCWRHDVCAHDFVQERTHDGRAFRMLVVVDEFSRQCLAILVARRLNSDDVLMLLTELFVTHGPRDHIRSDNGSEFCAHAVRDWLKRLDVSTLFIESDSPWENSHCERFNGKLRDELSNTENFCTLKEATILIEQWRRHYNVTRPQSSLGYRPPEPETIVPASAALAPLARPRQQACASTNIADSTSIGGQVRLYERIAGPADTAPVQSIAALQIDRVMGRARGRSARRLSEQLRKRR